MKRILVDISATGHDINEISFFPGTAILRDDLSGVAQTVRDLIHAVYGYRRSAEFRCKDRVEEEHWHWTHRRNTPEDEFFSLVRKFPTGGHEDMDHVVVIPGRDGVDPCCGPRDANCRLEYSVTDDLFETIVADPDNFSILEID